MLHPALEYLVLYNSYTICKWTFYLEHIKYVAVVEVKEVKEI